MSFTIAIIGRPNVGKSTLFNRLTGTDHALVHDLPGVTRDRREGKAKLSDRQFTLIDTAGLEEAKQGALEHRMMQQTTIAVEQADLCLLMMDGRAGLTNADSFFAKWIRKFNKPVIVLVNKCEGKEGEAGFHEATRLGFEHTIAISAEHSEGFADIYQALDNYFPEPELEGAEQEKALQIAIIGRPNTGKSTFLNALLGDERVLTGPEAGITRDAIAISWQYKEQLFRLIDTAGMRKKANVTKNLEKLSVTDARRAIRFAHIVVVMIDATIPLEKQDLTICDHAIKEGRGIIIVFNKWDLIDEKEAALKELQLRVKELLPFIRGVPIIPISALNQKGIFKVIDTSLDVYKAWNKRISTAKLNEWLSYAVSAHTPPLGKNRRAIKMKYMTQGNTRPPTFTLFTNRPQDVPQSYRRYLVSHLREYFDLPGVPIRLMLRSGDNPYKK